MIAINKCWKIINDVIKINIGTGVPHVTDTREGRRKGPLQPPLMASNVGLFTA